MGHRLITRDPRTGKSPAYKALGYLFIGLVLVLNPVSIPLFQEQGWLPQVHYVYLHGNDLQIYLPLLLDLSLLALAAMIFFAERRLPWYFNNSKRFNQLLLFMGFLLLLVTNPLFTGRLEVLRFLYVLLLLFVLINSFYLTFVRERKQHKGNKGFRNVGVSLYALLFLFLLLEGIFLFVARSHHYNGTLASRNWFNRHWVLNSEGYRDREISERDSSKHSVLFLGDSFTSGHGLSDPDDRMSNRLERALGSNEWRVYNVGKNGSDTRDVYQRLLRYPVEPDMVIYAWYVNDIELVDSTNALSQVKAQPYADVNFALKFLLRRSYFLNYLYWLYPHPSELQDYGKYVKRCFANPDILNEHQKDLEKLVSYAEERSIPLYVVVFPLMEHLDDTRFATDPVESFFAERGVPAVSVRKLLEGETNREITVNKNDSHPSSYVNRKVAEELEKLIKAGL